ncbi:tRNA (5-methylaminomethyl-2-thiouridine)(34)-methyltransferase MnmD [Roseobacter sp. GAI101]|uniref:tRNA (5-methylaminomethyl-2-thiouridine)(34)-methyltransferase MnmD n=1 Tax=Roseobacter sp. (strain GAI101) TaxID=391589 RepID=UPI00018719FA|nr:tRNA (5-methylaminomethyl-2-thiouridine)(34)-methyltransferase MnmD [Roseobacter sp. GAI101]EEB85678.1 oxidoreductase, FAD-dependent [Roseobacter sp. GAI101]
MENQTAQIEWKDSGVPVSSQFDDPYFSLENGVEETRYVFLQGNDLPTRFRDGFRIGELGFGTGLNLLVAWDAWAQKGCNGTLQFTSFEAFPMSREDMAQAHQAFPEFNGKRDALLEAWTPEGGNMTFPGLDLTVVIGDARQTVPAWDGVADAWFLDGFSPAKNPELWEPDLLEDVARHTAHFGTAATYTAAGAVRRALESVGFAVERTKGYGRKRHMTRAVRV